MIIKIPFHNRFIMEIASGRKTKTTRSKRYGKVGDIFYLAGRKIKCEIMGTIKIPLKDIVEKYWRDEGFRSKEEMIGFWLTIHRKYEPEKKFWIHSFRRIQGDS